MDLQKFCSTDLTRVNINKPFSRGEYTYATNGHILVRIARIGDIGEQEKSDKFKPTEPETLFAAVKDYPYHPIPDIPVPLSKDCFKCAGTGKTKTCPECDGDGEVHFSTRWNDYTCECESCNGDGLLVNGKGPDQTCDKCDGSGKIIETKNYEASGRLYNGLYLSWLKELPDCVLAAAEGTEPGHFKFTGGDGLIMPLRW